ncbi:MAG: DUF58 domain-containing protein [Saprospiraceae bacterium]|nr:DUF58 domain-containing protein [Saprospiraceae bacterium]
MYKLRSVFKNLYIERLFFQIGIGLIVLFVTAFFIPFFTMPAYILLFVFAAIFIIDVFILFLYKNAITASRKLPEKLSNGDENEISVKLRNLYPFDIYYEIIDELPAQFQLRTFCLSGLLKKNSETTMPYILTPYQRGVYEFGNLHVYVRSPIRMIARRYSYENGNTVKVYPSFIQLKKYDLMAISDRLMLYGVKKVRRLGHTMEFEKINEYVAGDDVRTINWKATAKSSRLMVNQYQDEKSQSVYCIMDKGRLMKMPFNGLTLLDHAINACLVLSGVILRKQDKVGMMTISKRVDNVVGASSRSGQMQKILESLYHIQTNFSETDFGRLYGFMKKNVSQRSLVLLFTNFETMDSLRRQLRFLQAIAKNHLLVIVFFENTELNKMIRANANSEQEIIDKVMAEKFAFEKKLIVRELQKHGIRSLLTKPENLTIDAINQYISLKAGGLI